MARAPSHRPERIAGLVQETIAQALAQELKDPRVGFVTVTGVTVSPDGGHATVRVSVLGTDDEKTKALEGLDSARGFLRTYVARSLRLRSTPDIRFELDRGLEHAAHINRLLAKLKHPEEQS